MVSFTPARASAFAAATAIAAVGGAVGAGPAAAQVPAADVYVPPGIGVDTWRGAQTLPVAVNVVNFGDLAAADVTRNGRPR